MPLEAVYSRLPEMILGLPVIAVAGLILLSLAVSLLSSHDTGGDE
jgi:hypothetical protein